MNADPRRAAALSLGISLVLALVLVLGLVGGCARAGGPPPIAPGAECATCGMSAGNHRFACEQEVDGRWRVYDSIECLLADGDAGRRIAAGGGRAGPRVYLADYDTRTLHRADSLSVVHGDFHSPMGGGYAAFLDRAAADSLAAVTRGRVLTLDQARTGAQAAARAEARP